MKGLTDTEILHRTAEIKYKIMIHIVMIHIYNQWRQSCWSALGRQLLPKFFCLSSFHVPQPIWLSPPFASDISNQFWQRKHSSVNIFFYTAHHYIVWGTWKLLRQKNLGKNCLPSLHVTRPHVPVVWDEVPVAWDGGQEHQGVGSPGNRPCQQHHHSRPPQLLLWLQAGVSC